MARFYAILALPKKNGLVLQPREDLISFVQQSLAQGYSLGLPTVGGFGLVLVKLPGNIKGSGFVGGGGGGVQP